MRPNEGESSDGAGGSFGSLTPFNTAIPPPHEPREYTHSKAHAFERGRSGT